MIPYELANSFEGKFPGEAVIVDRGHIKAPTFELGGVRVVYGWVHHCPVTGHRARLLQEIVRRPVPAECLVRPSRVDGEGAQQLAVLGHDADVGAGDEEADLAVAVGDAQGEVAQAAQVAQGQLAEAVCLVAADTVANGAGAFGGTCLEAATKDLSLELLCIMVTGSRGTDPANDG